MTKSSSFGKRKSETGYEHLYNATVEENYVLNPAGSKHYRHLTLRMPGIGDKVTPGDYIGLFTENAKDEVERLLTASHLSPHEKVTVRERKNGWYGDVHWQETLTLEEALKRWIHIEEPKKELLELIASRTDAASQESRRLRFLLAPENEWELKKFMAGNTTADVLEYFPKILSAQELCDYSHNLDQRRFTISDIKPDTVSLVESPIEYEIPHIPLLPDKQISNIKRQGVFTKHIANLSSGDNLRFYISASNFGLPNKAREKPFADDAKALDAPMIFIGAGTGIVPYLPMMEELEKNRYRGSCWLITGNRSEETDLLYKDKLEQFTEKGILGKVSFAASRQEGKPTRHVQDIVRDEGKEIWSKLQQGGYVYLCGDRAIDDDIRIILQSIAINYGKMNVGQAEKWLKSLEESGHFQAHSYRQSLEFEKTEKVEQKAPWPVEVDVLVIGSGPAGLTAGMYAARANHKTLILEGNDPGGQLAFYKGDEPIANFPGFDKPLPASEFIRRMRIQAENFGAQIITDTVNEVDFNKRPLRITGQHGKVYIAKSVIIATGAQPKWLGVPGEQEFRGRGVSNCTTCDAPLFENKDVLVVGGGDSAAEEALSLHKAGARVKIVHRRDSLKASPELQHRLREAEPPIDIIWNSEVTRVHGATGGSVMSGVSIRNIATGKEERIAADGMFVAIGHAPENSLFKNQLRVDNNGYVITATPGGGTSAAGVYAAGGVMHKYNSADIHCQAVTSAADGAAAAMSASQFLGTGVHKGATTAMSDSNILQMLGIFTLGAAAAMGFRALFQGRPRDNNISRAA